ncbi:MAG TPA: DUF1080 domain-containing protein [Polyangiaceae bacterium]
MKRLLLAVALATALCRCQAKDQDLMPKADLAGFRRVPIEPLASKPVWTIAADGKTLVIEGVGAKEMLLYDKELGDGVLHVEWRFRKIEETDPAKKPWYNGGVYARTASDGKIYVQAQVAHQDKPPVVGDIIAQVPDKKERVNVYQTAASAERPIGEWNTYDLTMRGKTIELVVNGKPSVTWNDCPMPRGRIGLQAEGAVVEVRAFRYREL